MGRMKNNEMDGKVFVGYQADADVQDTIKGIALANDCTMSDVLEMIINDYLTRNCDYVNRIRKIRGVKPFKINKKIAKQIDIFEALRNEES